MPQNTNIWLCLQIIVLAWPLSAINQPIIRIYSLPIHNKMLNQYQTYEIVHDVPAAHNWNVKHKIKETIIQK
jgi:hypothetical protein